MSRGRRGRLLRLTGWLLTPFVAWAASFFGAWAGAALGRFTESAAVGLVWLVGGGAVAGAAALIGWSWLIRRSARGESTQSSGEDA